MLLTNQELKCLNFQTIKRDCKYSKRLRVGINVGYIFFVNYTFILSCWVWKSNETCDAQENYKIKVLFRI